MRAHFLRVCAELHGLRGGIAARSRDHRNAARGMLDSGGDEATVLVDADGRRFARRADDDDPGGAIRHMEIDQLAKCGKIQRPARLHWRRDRDDTSGQHR